MQNEQIFWHDLLATANPGWNIHIDPRHPVGTGMLASNDVMVYLVDCGTGWMTAAALPSSEMRRAAADAAAQPDLRDMVRSGAVEALVELGKSRPDAQSAEAREALLLAVLALTQLSLYQTVLKACGGHLRGHWFYVAYPLRSGTALGRGFFAGKDTNQFMSREQCLAAVRTTLQHDRSPTSNVGSQIAAGGGPVLAEEFQ
jgi:hypothetical protein